MRTKLLVCALLLGACSEDSTAPGADGAVFEEPDSGLVMVRDASAGDALVQRPDAEPEQCTKRWTVFLGEAARPVALIEDGLLTLDAELIEAGSVAVRLAQDGLEGDFDIAFRFEGFVAGADGAYARAFVARSAEDVAAASIETMPEPGVAAAFLRSGGDSDRKQSTSWSGVMRLRRDGDRLTITTTTDDATSTATSTMGGPLRLGLEIGNSGTEPVVGATTIRFSEMTASADASIEPDDFECDSLAL